MIAHPIRTDVSVVVQNILFWGLVAGVGLSTLGCGDDEEPSQQNVAENQNAENQNAENQNNESEDEDPDDLFLEKELDFTSGLVRGPDDLIYVSADWSGGTVAFKPDAEIAWEDGSGYYTPTVDLERNRMFVSSSPGARSLAWIDPETGEFSHEDMWSTTTAPDNGAVGLALDKDGNVYHYNDDGKAFAHGTDGEELWTNDEYVATTKSEPQPVVSDEYGIFCFGTDDGELVALSLDDGEVSWTVELQDEEEAQESEIRSSPAIGDDGVLYIGSAAGLNAIDLNDGSFVWQYEDEDLVSRCAGDVVISPDGESIYLYCSSAGQTQSTMIAVDKQGEELWTTDIEPWGRAGGAVIGDNGTVYQQTWFAVVAFDPETGQQKWVRDISDDFRRPELSGTPVLDDDGNLYIATDSNGRIFKIETESGGISESSPWPTTGGDQQRTGRAN